MRKVLTYFSVGPRSPTVVVFAALLASMPAFAGEVLFVSDSETDADNIPAVLSAEHNVTVVRNDYVVTGGTFGAAEGTNPTLKGDLSGYCAVFWSASGPHEPLGLSPDRMTNGSFEDFNGTFVDTGAADGYMVLGTGDLSLPGWTISMPVAWGITPTDGFAASEGDGFVDLSSLGDTSSGDISQDIATTNGTDYVLSIDRQGGGSVVSLNGTDIALTAGATNGDWTTYTANFTATGDTTTLRIRKDGAGSVVFVDNISFVPQPPAPLGLGADGGLHTDPDVFTNLASYVDDGGFVFVTGHDAIAHPFDPLLADFVGGPGSGSGQEIFPAHSAVNGIPATAITVGSQSIVGFTPNGGGINPVDTVPEQDFLIPGGGFTPLVSLGGGFAWTVRHPSVAADDFFNGGHIAYVANGIFFYETEQEDAAMNPVTETLSDGQDPSWLVAGGAYHAALLNFAENGCAEPGLPTIDDLYGRGKGDKVNLTWTGNGADEYQVFRSLSSGGPYAFLGSTTNNVYVDSPVTPGLTYYYVVLGVFGGVNSDNSNEAEVAVPAGRRR